jgi:3-hydroxymyristoyl/3-hydroxydecanoyl-(acyl carrier protein) dehydratase
VRFLDGVGFSVAGGEHGHGYGHGFKVVDKRDWFFSCHFWCDPVMPGSLGIEAMHQTLELFCVQTGLAAGIERPTFSHDIGVTKWKYRGQLTPKNERCDVEVHVKSVERANGRVTVVADGYLYVDSLRVYHVTSLRLRVQSARTMRAP